MLLVALAEFPIKAKGAEASFMLKLIVSLGFQWQMEGILTRIYRGTWKMNSNKCGKADQLHHAVNVQLVGMLEPVPALYSCICVLFINVLFQQVGVQLK